MKTIVSLSIFACGLLHAGMTPIGEHADIVWSWTPSGGWSCHALVRDFESVSGTSLDLDTVFFPLSDKPYINGNPADSGSRRIQPNSAAFDFTGIPDGHPLWLIPQGTPGIGEAWIGMDYISTSPVGSYVPDDERVTDGVAQPWVKVSLVGYTPPLQSEAHFSMWKSSGPQVWMSTFEDGLEDCFYLSDFHEHMNWGFSALGIHRIRLQASAFAGPGETNPTGPSPVFTVTVTIGPFAYWQALHFTSAELDDPLISGPMADADKDGLRNLEEFAFGFHPRIASRQPISSGLGMPRLSIVEDSGSYYEVLEYPRRRSGEQIAPLAYDPRFSADLSFQEYGTVETTTTDMPPDHADLNEIWEMALSKKQIGQDSPRKGFARIGLSFQSMEP
jgi:surface-anchored protein